MRALVPKRFYYGWVVLAGSVVAMALGSGVSFWAFGLYVDPMEEEFGWSRAEVSAGFSVSLAVAGLSGPLIGRWIDLRGPRSAILVGAVATAVTYVLLWTTNSLWQWFVYLAINATFRQLMFFIPFQALVSRWFDKKRGVALGILGTGFSLGGFAVVPLMAFVIEQFDWDGSFLFSAGVMLGIYVPLGLFVVRNDPSDVGENVDGESEAAAEQRRRAGPLHGMTIGQAVKTPLFWCLALAMTLFLYGVFGWLVHQVPFYESVGISREVAATLVSIAAGFSILARLTFGFIVDRFPRVEYAAMGLLAFLISALVALMVNSSTAGIAVFLVLWIVGSGGGPLLEPLLLTRAFGLAHFATILGSIQLVETLGIISSPTIAGAIYDATGSYDIVLVVLASAFVGAFVLFGVASRMPHPVEAHVPPAAIPAAPIRR